MSVTTRTHRREPKASPVSNKSAEVLAIVSPAIAPNAEEAAREAFYASAEANASEAPARLGETIAPVTIEENSITSEDVLSLLAEIASPDSTNKSASKSGNKISREEFRYVKNAVEVDGVRYSSVYKAFLALGLPVGRHIGFRAKLKTAGALAFVNEGRTYGFKVI